MSIVEPKSSVKPGEQRPMRTVESPWKVERSSAKEKQSPKQPCHDYRKPQGGGDRSLG